MSGHLMSSGRNLVTANRMSQVMLLVALIAAGHVMSNTDARSGNYNYPSQPTDDAHLYPRQETPQSHERQDDALFHPLGALPSQHSFTWAPQQEFSTMAHTILQHPVADSRYASSYQQSGGQTGYQSGYQYGQQSGQQSQYGNSQSGYQSGNSYYPMSGSGNSVTKGKGILLDPTNLIDFALQMTIPFTIDYSFLGLGRRKRDVDSVERNPMADQVDDLMQINLAKLRTVFLGLGVHEAECLEEIICVLHRRSHQYHPLPNFIRTVLNLDNLKPDFENHFSYINSTNALDYSRYVRAVQRGVENKSSTCTVSDAPWCSLVIDSILNRPTFKFLQYVNNFGKTKMAFSDEA